MQVLLKYFPGLPDEQKQRFIEMDKLYRFWNKRINLISRKDIDNLYLHHVLHSLSVAKIFTFQPNCNILDAGTGGGFPGIPLAILFPDVNFHLVDATKKKINAVDAIKEALGIKNIKTSHNRIEALQGTYDFILTRAVMALPVLAKNTEGLVSNIHKHSCRNGIISLKGGDINNETRPFKDRIKIYDLTNIFDEPYFRNKIIVYLSF